MEEKLYAGYDRQEVTPDESIPLTGYSNEPKRFHTSIAQPICITAIALTDSGDNTILMIGMDTCHVPNYLAEEGLDWLAGQVGLPKDRIFIAGTHTHCAPCLNQNKRFPSAAQYSEKFYGLLVVACKNALADRKAVSSMSTGSIETENMNFIKHYKCTENATGKIVYIGDQFGDPKKCTYIDHATKVDPTMHIVKFERTEGKPVVIANFRAHPHFDGGTKKYALSSDYIGAFRTALESLVDCHAVYFQGACGNVNASTRLPAERRYTSAVSYGLGLAGYAAECLHKHMTQVPVGPIRTKQTTVYGEINHTMDYLKEEAAAIREVWDTTFDREKCDAMSLPLGIRSPYHAGAIKWNAMRTKEEDGWMILNAVAIGDKFAFTTFPGEMFDSISVRMEENSPFDTTMMLGYCCHHIGYLPSRVAYKYTSYETDITRFAPGTGEFVADEQVKLLKEIK